MSSLFQTNDWYIHSSPRYNSSNLCPRADHVDIGSSSQLGSIVGERGKGWGSVSWPDRPLKERPRKYRQNRDVKARGPPT